MQALPHDDDLFGDVEVESSHCFGSQYKNIVIYQIYHIFIWYDKKHG